jgi:hypothetical protein
VVADRREIVAAIDCTDFDADDQSTLVLSMITNHGRATPLLEKTVMKSEMQGWRNVHEDVLLERFREVLPEGVQVTVLADLGFGDQALHELLEDIDGEVKPAKDWVPANGRPLLLRDAKVTKKGRELGTEIVKLYGKGFTVEESFQDQKNLRFGMGLSETRIGSPERRDRMLLVNAIGHDKWLKANTVKHRTLSLLSQGLFHYAALPIMMTIAHAEALIAKFGEMLREQRVFRETFGLI